MRDIGAWPGIALRGIVIAVMALSIIAIVLTMARSDDAAQQAVTVEESGETEMAEKQFPVQKTDEEWRALLTPEQYKVTRTGGTECAFTGQFWNDHRDGVYHCVCCGNPLFSSEAKFESGTGWPSYFKPVGPERVYEKTDRSHGMVRTEVLCNRCGAHLGHVFRDGPEPTGLRFCINSVALVWKPELVEPTNDTAAPDAAEAAEE